MTLEETIADLKRIQLLTEDKELAALLGDLLEVYVVDLGYDS